MKTETIKGCDQEFKSNCLKCVESVCETQHSVTEHFYFCLLSDSWTEFIITAAGYEIFTPKDSFELQTKRRNMYLKNRFNGFNVKKLSTGSTQLN